MLEPVCKREGTYGGADRGAVMARCEDGKVSERWRRGEREDGE